MRALAAVALAAAGALAAPALALDPGRAVTQYELDVWKSEQGLPLDGVDAILRTRDGYLWLGTQLGLARFDGVRFEVFDRARFPEIPDNVVNVLLEDGSGALWVGTSGGLVVRRPDPAAFAAEVAEDLPRLRDRSRSRRRRRRTPPGPPAAPRGPRRDRTSRPARRSSR